MSVESFSEPAPNPMPGWKRLLDLACCVPAMPLLGLCTAVMALVTKTCAPGPIFFRQERVGQGGRRFMLYKFRTMSVGADTSVHQAYFSHLMTSDVPMQKMDARRDARLIPGGWFLRASGFDELPQIVNILRGEMSLVGPRPCLPYEYERYLPWQRRRFDATPGLTSLWQVSGKNRTTFDEMMHLDISYSRRKSLWLDLWILVLTPGAILAQIIDTRRARRSPPAASAAALADSYPSAK